MSLVIPGWADRVATVHGVKIGEVRQEKSFSWRPLHLDRVRLHHAAHLSILQGLSPLHLFLASCLEDSHDSFSGLHLLKYRPSPAWSSPFFFSHVTCGQLLHLAESVPPSEALASMLMLVANSSC